MDPTAEHQVRIGRRLFDLVPWFRTYLDRRDEIVREDSDECYGQPPARYEAKLRRVNQRNSQELLEAGLVVPAPSEEASEPHPAVEERSTIHEAGHVIVGYLLGIPVRKVAACAVPVCDPAGNEIRTPYCWGRMSDDVDPVVRATWVVSGGVAVEVLLGDEDRSDWFDVGDLDDIVDRSDMVRRESAALKHEARQKAERLVREHETAIRYFADRLMERPILSGRRFERTLARAIALDADAQDIAHA